MSITRNTTYIMEVPTVEGPFKAIMNEDHVLTLYNDLREAIPEALREAAKPKSRCRNSVDKQSDIQRESVGRTLRKMRLNMGLTTGELALAYREDNSPKTLSAPSISAYETGRTTARPDYVNWLNSYHRAWKKSRA